MGSLPWSVDEMFESRVSALYQRVLAKITKLTCNTQELCCLFKQFQLNLSPSKMLTIRAPVRKDQI